MWEQCLLHTPLALVLHRSRVDPPTPSIAWADCVKNLCELVHESFGETAFPWRRIVYVPPSEELRGALEAASSYEEP